MAYEFNHYYELQNVATGKYVNVLGNHEDGTVKNGETVNLFSRTNNPDQRWALENFGGNGNVRIVLQRGEGWYALNYNTRNTNCIVWHLNTADDTDTVITTVEVENRPNTYYLMPTYYWSRLCALNITPQFCVELVAWVIVALAVAAGLGWMALHRPDAGKQRSVRKPHAVLRRREKSAARQGMHRASTFSAALYALRCTRLPGMLALFGLLCMAFALEVSESRIVDATWADGRRVGIFPGGSLPVGSAADAALGTVLSVGILAWIAVILVAVMAFHQNKTAGAARLAVTYGVSRVRYMVGSFAAETIMLQGWYMVLYFLLSVVTGSLSQPGHTAFFWMQSAWILQASYAVVWLVCRLCGSELAGATFCFVVTLAGVIVSVSAPDPAAVSPLSALLFYATPMPYWLALGGGHSIPWQAVGYGAGVTALCLAAALAITTVRDVE